MIDGRVHDDIAKILIIIISSILVKEKTKSYENQIKTFIDSYLEI